MNTAVTALFFMYKNELSDFAMVNGHLDGLLRSFNEFSEPNHSQASADKHFVSIRFKISYFDLPDRSVLLNHKGKSYTGLLIYLDS